MNGIYTSLGVSLLLTLVFESVFALALKKRGRGLLLVLLVNLLTNPPVVLLHWLLVRYARVSSLLVTAALETAAIVTEGCIYRVHGRFQKPYLFSLAANALSYGLGLLLQTILW